MSGLSDRLASEFVSAAHTVARNDLVRSSSGNLSCRIGKEHMLISAQQSWMERMDKKHIAVCRLIDCSSINDKKPSVECQLHSAIYLERTDINVVLHFQSPNATTLACRNLEVETPNFHVIPEIPYYIGDIGVVPYISPGTEALADHLAIVMKDYNLAMLSNHGQVVVGESFDEVIQRAVFFELACEILVKAGSWVQTISRQDIEYLRMLSENKGSV